MPVEFVRYHEEKCGIKNIVESWITKARRTSDDFDKFYYLWSAFNSWALIVTLQKTDAAMVKDIANNPRAQNIYKRKIIPENGIINRLNQAVGSFPLQNFSDLVRIDQNYDWRGNQGSNDYNKKIVNSGSKVKCSPVLDPSDFCSVLQCMYAVRCNLIHGSKMATEGEQKFVHIFSSVLEKMLTGELSLLTIS